MSNVLFSHQKDDLIKAARLVAKELLAELQSEKNLLNSNLDKEDLLTQKQCAEFLDVTVGTLILWRKKGKIPYLKTGRTILYSKERVLQSMQNL